MHIAPLLSHLRKGLSLFLLLPIFLLGTLFVGKQTFRVPSVSLSISTDLSLLPSQTLSSSPSRLLLPPLPPPPKEEVPSTSPADSPPEAEELEESASADENDRGKDEISESLSSPPYENSILGPDPAALSSSKQVITPRADEKKCDLYKGSWVRDEEGRYPLYAPGSCPYVDEAYSCQENGREDEEYLKWRWKPDDCELPRFNTTDFLERLRGKRLMLVGDSMNRNQFESMLCILREALPNKSRMYETNGNKITKGRGYFNFLFVDYNCTITFVRSHFLVREGTRINRQGNSNPILMIDHICKSSTRWKRADILVFNTGHWWTHGKTSRGKDYFKEGDVIYPQFDANEAFNKAMHTWGSWIDRNMDPKRNLIFYRGYSTAHFRGGDWDSGGTCHGETSPAFNGPILNSYPLKMKTVENVISKMTFPVSLLNVTNLTSFRKDGHPSIYGKLVTKGQKISRKRQDCSHWCLPGVPDAWNELIYAALVLEHK